MSSELIHLSCWALLASMVVFLIVGGMKTFHEFRDLMRERRSRRTRLIRATVIQPSRLVFRFA